MTTEQATEYFRRNEDFDPEREVVMKMGPLADAIEAMWKIYDSVPHIGNISLVQGGASLRNALHEAMVNLLEAIPNE